jgi:hypothetical protein
MSDYSGFTKDLYSACSFSKDKNSAEYRRATDSERNKCCLDTCMPLYSSCMKHCHESKDLIWCKNVCINAQKACGYGCQNQMSEWGKKDPVYYISTDLCGKYSKEYQKLVLSKECMKDKEQEIISKCMKSCTPSSQVDCDRFCRYSFDSLYDYIPVKFLDYNQNESPLLKKPEKSSHKDKEDKEDYIIPYLSYIPYIVSALVLLLGIIILFRI